MLTTSAQGFAGGEDGLCGAFLLNPGTDAERKLPSAAVDLPLRQGDLLRVLTPGGGVHYQPVVAIVSNEVHKHPILRY